MTGSAGAVRRLAIAAVAVAVATSCGGDESTSDRASTAPTPATEPARRTEPTEPAERSSPTATTASTAPPTPATAPSSTAPPTSTPTTAPAVTAAPPSPSTAPSTAPVAVPDGEETFLGASVQGRPITVVRRGEPDGEETVLVIGAIHGDEDAGTAIVDALLTAPVPPGIELWLVRSMNPDGQAARIRHNANGVDLNRNFPENWGPIAGPGDWQYAGPAAASEPETQAMLRLAELVRPDLTLWYHQDLFRINPARGRDGEVRARYAELTGLPIVEVTGGTYTGTASTWSRSIADDGGIGFTVELGESLTDEEAQRHAAAVLEVAADL